MYPKKYNPDTIKRITDAIKDGHGRVSACKKGGISYETFTEWLDNKPDFVEHIKNAEVKGTVKRDDYAIASIFKAMEKDWRAGAWWMERTHQDVYALKYRLEHSGPGGGPIVTKKAVDLSKLTTEMLEKIAAALDACQ